MVGSKVRPPLMAQVVLTTWTQNNRANKLMNSLVTCLLKHILPQFFKIQGVSCCLLAFLSLCLNVSNSWIALFASETSKTQKTFQKLLINTQTQGLCCTSEHSYKISGDGDSSQDFYFFLCHYCVLSFYSTTMFVWVWECFFSYSIGFKH